MITRMKFGILKMIRTVVAIGLLVSVARAALAQAVIDTKFVGGPTDQNGGYEDPSKFVIASNGAMFLVCPNGIFGSASQGVRWTQLDATTTGDFCFAPDSTLYLAAMGGVFSSTNFGANWTNLSVQLPDGPFSSIVALPDGTIFTSCPTGIFRSIDKGADWDHVGQAEFPGSSVGAYLTATLKGTVMGRNGNTYYRSTDEGTTWSKSVPLTIQIWPVTETNILRPGDNGLERSTDDGISWHAVPGAPKGIPYDVAMDTSGNLFLFFGYQLYISRDSGTTWNVDGTISGGGQQLAFGADHTLFFFKPSEGMWRTLKPLSGVPMQTETSGLFLREIIFPASTEISVTLPERSDLQLSLFDLRGEKIERLASGSFGPGTHNFTLPERISSGTYFCVLQTPSGARVIKMVRP